MIFLGEPPRLLRKTRRRAIRYITPSLRSAWFRYYPSRAVALPSVAAPASVAYN
jgi:hypothetical protein